MHLKDVFLARLSKNRYQDLINDAKVVFWTMLTIISTFKYTTIRRYWKIHGKIYKLSRIMAYAKDVDVMNKRVTLLLEITSRKKMMQKDGPKKEDQTRKLTKWVWWWIQKNLKSKEKDNNKAIAVASSLDLSNCILKIILKIWRRLLTWTIFHVNLKFALITKNVHGDRSETNHYNKKNVQWQK